MARTSFGRQFVALMKRNYLLKKRNKKHTIQEIVSPIYFVLILAIIRLTTSPDERPAIPNFPENDITAAVYQPDPTKVLLVAPNTTNVKSAINDTLNILASGQSDGSEMVPEVQFFETEQNAEDAYRDNYKNKSFGIIFEDGDLNDLNYTIRVPYGTTPSVDNLYDSGAYCRGEEGLDRCASNLYLYDGFSNLQLALDSALIKMKSMDEFSRPDVRAKMMPKDSWIPDVSWVQVLASLYFVMAYAPFVNFMVVALVSEKEKKIKEGMRMMGLRDSAFWLAWGMTYFILLTVVNLVVVLISFTTLFPNSNMFLFFLIITFYSLCIITMSFTMTPFFNKAETAGGLASLATMVFSLLYLPVSLTRTVGPEGPVSTIPVGGQWAMCLLPPVALALAIDQAVYLDISQGGMDFNNLTYGQFPLYASLTMLFVDFIIFGLLAVYFDNIVPSEYGQRRPPYYFLQPSFWCSKKNNDQKEDVYDTRFNDATVDIPNDLVEPISEELKHSDKIRIRDIRKVFKSQEDGKKQVTAVDGVTLDLYEGQITCLLGHNGAGKTTILNMLTGMTSPASGNATIYGYNVSDPNDMTEIRSMTGVCPQHNILLDYLTCQEHLEFYGILKGVNPDDLQSQIRQSLRDIDLSDQADTRSIKLSGGQKRKLSVAIALIGDPKIIFLDEPTAGMDPFSRRHLWSLLKERRPGRVILLTTHFMDEADILADRKAFISKGKLTCVGSSLFLKNRFGVGYHLSMVVDDPKESSNSIHQFVMTHIPQADISRIHGKEVDITLPLTSVDKFAALFRDLERSSQGGASLTQAETMGIRSYGISMTSLEEVFLKIGIEETGAADDEDSLLGHTPSSPLLRNSRSHGEYTTASSPTQSSGGKNRVSPTHIEIESGNGLASQNYTNKMYGDMDSVTATTVTIPRVQMAEDKELRNQRFWAFCKVRVLSLVRNPASFVFRIVFPVLFIIIGTAVMAFGPSPERADSVTALELNAGLYSKVNGEAGNNNPSMLLQAPPPVVLNTTDFIQMLFEQGIAMTNVTNATDILSIAPHHAGLKVYHVDAINPQVTSDITVMYNDTAFHSFPATVNVISNTLLKMLTNSNATVTTYVRFWPNLKDAIIGYDNTVLSAVILLGLAMSIIPPAFGTAVVREREIKARSLLRISGVTMNMYWSCVFAVDFVQFFSAAVLSIVAVLIFQVQSLMYGGAIVALILLYLLYIPVNMFLSYVLSFAFDKMETAQVALFNIFFFASFLPYMAVSMMDMFGVETAATILHYVLVLIDPCYAVFGGLYYIARVYLIESIVQQTEEPNIAFDMYFAWDSKIPITLIAPLFHAIWLFFLLRLLEVKKTGGETSEVCCVSGKSSEMDTAVTEEEVNTDIPEDEDEDVEAERDKVRLLQQQGQTEELPVIVVEGLRREYAKNSSTSCGCKKQTKEEKTKVAVRNNTFTVSSGEVFGLLGPNGAGKTTTLNMIIAEEGLTKGKVSVAGYDIKSSLSDAFQAMGYCPQHDALWDDITLKEHLMCYAQLTGIAKSEADIVVQYFLDSLHIDEHANKKSKKLSGGTKRKLSYAISMLGEAQVVLLDEPSTGMDPKSKRFMWDTISSTFSGSSRGAILTTHYMEEADALCSRVGIMVNGEMECLGSTQHLKNKYGSGYLLEIKLDQNAHVGTANAEDEPMKALDETIQKMFSNPILTECFGDRAMYSIPQSDVNSLADVFAALEKGKKELGIEEYCFSQSTLEQVFLSFAKHQLEDQEEEQDEKQALKQKKSSMRQVSVNDQDQRSSTEL